MQTAVSTDAFLPEALTFFGDTAIAGCWHWTRKRFDDLLVRLQSGTMHCPSLTDRMME
ncbi:MAG: hypothetical protein ACREWG_17315 [Gammaproteobacteria bacterium]